MSYRCREPRPRRCAACGEEYVAKHPASRTCGDGCRFLLVYLRVWLRSHRLRGIRRDKAKARLMLAANHLWARLG